MKVCSMYTFVLASFLHHNVFEIHPCFAWINDLFLFICKMCSIEWMYHSLFILSSFDGYLGCFQFWQLLLKMYECSCISLFVGMCVHFSWMEA